jgi:uncharacterized protein YkwD
MRRLSWIVGAGAFLLCTSALPQQPSAKEVKLLPQEKEIVDLVNQYRAKNKLPPLKLSAMLSDLARQHSANMARQGKLSHKLDDKTPFQRAEAVGYKGLLGENIAGGGVATPKMFFALWLKSDSHRQNMLGDITEIGVGFARSADGSGHYYTAMFGAGK